MESSQKKKEYCKNQTYCGERVHAGRLHADTSKLNTPLRWAASGPGANLFMHYSHPFDPFGLSFGSLLVRFRILLAPFWYRLAHFCSPQGSIFSFWDLPASFLNFIILPTQILQKSKSFVQIVHSAVAETRPCRAKDKIYNCKFGI